MRAAALCAAAAALRSAAAAQCAARDGVVLGFQHDISHEKVKDVDACCSLCNGTATCASWTFHTDGSAACWLHSSADYSHDEGGVTSGVRDGPLPPTPPPTPKPGWDACTGADKALPYCDTSLTLDARLKDLTPRVSTADAGAQLTARQSPALGDPVLPAYYWGTNAIHGMQNVGCLPDGQCPTSFPAPCALSAAFNTSVVKDMGAVIGRELRAYYHSETHDSLDTWSPTINLNRDPRWGRNVESPGEDPLVCGEYGTAYTQGLQDGVDPKVRQATVTLKHWVAYSIESYNGVTRHNYNANVSAYDLANSYFPAWERTVKVGGAKGVMCSYNMLNGKPTCGNKDLTDTLRKDWGFSGYITSDTDACGDIYKSHKYEPTGELATRDCLLSGTDIDSGGTYKGYLQKAVESGALDRSAVDQALYNSYKMRFEMGLFDPDVPNEYRKITTAEVGSAAHQEMSARAARQAMVLLKNEKGTLPFPAGKNVAVIGRVAKDYKSLTGNYDGPLCPSGHGSCWPSICDTVGKRAQNATCVTDDGSTAAAVAAAQAADVVVLIADNAKDGGGEGHDRQTISLESKQQALCDAVLKVGKPTVLVLVNGGVIAIDGLKDSAPAILEAFMPGVHGAQAIADTIFGDNNPGGKMPVTMYHSSYINDVDFLSMDMNNGKGRSYRYYTGEPLFPFGFGLSYTTFKLEWSPQPPPVAVVTPGGPATKYTVVVTNNGTVAGDEVVFAYTKPKAATLLTLPRGTPVEKKRLFGFQRVGLAAGASQTLTFSVTEEQLWMVGADGHTALHSGEFDVVFSRGHGAELVARARADAGDAPARAKTFRKWW